MRNAITLAGAAATLIFEIALGSGLILKGTEMAHLDGMSEEQRLDRALTTVERNQTTWGCSSRKVASSAMIAAGCGLAFLGVVCGLIVWRLAVGQ